MFSRYKPFISRLDTRIVYSIFAAFLIAFIGFLLYSFIPRSYGIRFAFDWYDLNVYFRSSRWVVEGGRLYDDVASEYPLLANVMFAAVRYLSNVLSPGVHGFRTTWMAIAWLVYLFALYRVAKDTTTLATLAWVAPASIYFALHRFDIYPAVSVLLALFAIRRKSYIEGALWLGIAVALKGYALFLLPAYCVFLIRERGLRTAITASALVVLPLLLSLLTVMAFAGWEGALAPFRYHGDRTLNDESTYDAINYLFGVTLIPADSAVPQVAQALQIGCALGAAVMLPRTFDDLVHSFLFATLGFISFSVFYSPQFLLWVLPVVCFASSRVTLSAAIAFSWMTYLYFPLAFDLRRKGYTGLLETAVVAVTAVRLWIMLVTVKQIRNLFGGRDTGPSSSRSPSVAMTPAPTGARDDGTVAPSTNSVAAR